MRSSVQRLDRAAHRGGVDLVGSRGGARSGSAIAQRLVGIGGQRVDEVAQQFGRATARACRSRTSGRRPRRRRGAARRAAGRACRRARAPSRGSGVNSRSSLSSTSLRNRSGGSGRASICQRRWPCACSRNTSYWSTCAPTEPPVRREADHHVVDAPARQEAEALAAARRRRRPTCPRPAPAASSRGRGMPRELGFVERPVPQRPAHRRSRSCATMRDSAASSQARPARSSGVERRYEVRERVADQQRPLLPVVAQELAGGMPSGVRGVDFERGSRSDRARLRSSRASASARPMYGAGVIVEQALLRVGRQVERRR